jgi:hypothetical protein
MRTKVLLSLAAFAVSAFAAYAQSNVYSVNVVGYVNVTVPADKFAILSNPFETGNTSITNVVGGTLPDGTEAYVWNGTGYSDVEGYIYGFGWFPGTATVPNGTGFFIKPSGAPATVTFVGSITVNTNKALNLNGVELVGSQIPWARAIGDTNTANTLNFPAADGDTLYLWDVAAQGYKDAIGYIDGFGWFDPSATPVGPEGPTNNVAEGFFIQTTGSKNWNQILPQP